MASGSEVGAAFGSLYTALFGAVDSSVAVAYPYAQATVIVPPGLGNDYLVPIIQATGQSLITVKYLLAVLAAYPLAIVFASVRNATAKQLISLVTGFLLAQWVFEAEWIHAAITSVVAYFFMLTLRGFGILRPLAVFVWMMGYLTGIHIYRLHVDYMGWSTDVSGPMMLLTIKMISLAFNLYDGQHSSHKFYTREIEQGSRMKRIFQERMQRAVPHVPNPLAFFSYVFCFTTFFAGPSFEYSEFEAGVKESHFPKRAGTHVKDLQIKSRILVTLKRFALGLLFVSIMTVGKPIFNISDFIDPKSSIHNAPFYARVVFAWFSLMMVRMKYYFAWSWSEGSANLAGFGYRAQEKDWEGVKNIDALGFELSPSFTEATKRWNSQVQQWLARYGNQRLPLGINTFGTYLLSAFWHGFYPGYYMSFCSAPLATMVEKQFAHKLKPRMQALGSTAALIYDILGRIATTLMINYTILPFVALGWSEGLWTWSTLNYAGHIACIIVYIIFKFVPSTHKREEKREVKKTK